MTDLPDRRPARRDAGESSQAEVSRLGPPNGLFLPTVAQRLWRIVFGAAVSLHVEGLEHVPPRGPLIIVANHISLADPPLLIGAMPRPIALMAKEELLAIPIIGGLLRVGGGFPVKRGEADRTALRSSLMLLERGLAVVLFPEGTRSRTLQLQAGHKGVAFLARRSGAPVLPVGITGTEAFRQPTRLLKRPRVDVRIGEPFELRFELASGDRLTAATDHMMRRIAALLPPDRRGRYAYVE